MKLYQLLQSFEFEEIFPTVNVMFPNAQLHRDIFEKAFDMLCNIQPITKFLLQNSFHKVIIFPN